MVHNCVLMITHKTCIKCKEEKEILLFHKQSATKDGYCRYCIPCTREFQKSIPRQEWKKSISTHRLNQDLNLEEKKCSKCKNWKELTQFSKHRKCKDGLYTQCKDCCKLIPKRKPNDKSRECARKRSKKQFATNPKFRLVVCQRNRLRRILKNFGLKKTLHLDEYIGCTPEFLFNYIESLFKEGMSWENRTLWHIDHIRPLSSFDLSNVEEQKNAFHYTNLQPLWAIDNLKKGSKWQPGCSRTRVFQARPRFSR